MSAISVRYTIVLQTTESHAYGQKGLTLWVYWLSFVVSLQLDISFHIVPADCHLYSSWYYYSCCAYGPLTRYVKLRVAHAPGIPGTFSRHRLQRKPLVSHPGMHHGTCVTHVPWYMSGSLTRGGGKRYRHSRCMHSLQMYVSGKRPIVLLSTHWSCGKYFTDSISNWFFCIKIVIYWFKLNYGPRPNWYYDWFHIFISSFVTKHAMQVIHISHSS